MFTIKKLIIAEKPKLAKKIRKALKVNGYKNGYIENKDFIITWCYGHLLTLQEPADYDEKYKLWSYKDLPIVPKEFKIKPTKPKDKQRAKGIIKQLKTIKKLAKRKDVKTLINAGDAGREGELIVRYVLKYINNNKKVKRVWIKGTDKTSIKKAFNNLMPANKKDNLYQSAMTRNELDWLLGLNYTRAYTLKNEGRDLISVGRVQTPILKLIYDRDKKINEFEPVDYYNINAFFDEFKAKYFEKANNTRIFDKKRAEKIIKECKKEKEAKIEEINSKEKSKYAPRLFNQTDIQMQMNKGKNYSPSKTLKICQKLYEEYEILSYPRTDARHLFKAHIKEFPTILSNLNFGEFKKYINKLDINNLKTSKRFIDDKKITDHHAIIPTTRKVKEIYQKKLSSSEKEVFRQVVLRLLVQFFPKYKYKSTKIISVFKNKYKFKTKGKIVLNNGWREIYSLNKDDKKLPNLNEGDLIEVEKIKLANKKTKPPKYFTSATLLKQLQRYNIGTGTTRAGILSKVVYRGYIKKESKHIKTTKKGKKVVKAIITENIKSPKLTGQLQENLELIKKGKKSKDEILNNEINILKEEINKLKNQKFSIGEKNNSKKEICDCPNCEDGKIIGFDWGYGCSNYSKEKNQGCNFSISKKIASKKISKTQIKKICKEGKSILLKGFKSSKGNKFNAYIILKDNGETDFKFPKNNKTKSKTTEFLCPVCSKKLNDRGKFYGCSNYPKCKFSISKKICKVKINEEILKDLKENGESKTYKFKSKKGNNFKAKIKLKGEDTELKFKN